MAIQSFSDKDTEKFFVDGNTPLRAGWAQTKKVAKRKLDMLHFANDIFDLNTPPGNRLEALKGHLVGYYSIRINNQWRIVFKWSDIGPCEVKICDYH